jgi:hypothetical protein
MKEACIGKEEARQRRRQPSSNQAQELTPHSSNDLQAQVEGSQQDLGTWGARISLDGPINLMSLMQTALIPPAEALSDDSF